MPMEEKSAWIMGFVAVVGYSVYLALVIPRLGGPVAEVPYAATLLWTIGGAIVASIVLHIVARTASRERMAKKDQRDREIYRLGEYIGQSFVVIGAVGALLMALAEVAHFWIANAIYLAFVLSSILSSAARIVAYRRGFQSW